MPQSQCANAGYGSCTKAAKVPISLTVSDLLTRTVYVHMDIWHRACVHAYHKDNQHTADVLVQRSNCHRDECHELVSACDFAVLWRRRRRQRRQGWRLRTVMWCRRLSWHRRIPCIRGRLSISRRRLLLVSLRRRLPVSLRRLLLIARRRLSISSAGCSIRTWRVSRWVAPRGGGAIRAGRAIPRGWRMGRVAARGPAVWWRHAIATGVPWGGRRIL